jgi:hypothetical protein
MDCRWCLASDEWFFSNAFANAGIAWLSQVALKCDERHMAA